MRPSVVVSLLALLASSLPLANGRAVCRDADLTTCNSLDARGISPGKVPDPPKDPFRDPSHSPDSDTPSNPFRDPSSSPDIPSSPALSWGNVADGKSIKFDDAKLEAQRAKGAKMITDLEDAIKNNGGNKGDLTTLDAAGYKGQGTLHDKPIDEKYLATFPINVNIPWRGDRITKKDANDEILTTYEDPAQGAIIVKGSFGNDHDPNPNLRWTSMVMSNWRAAGNPKGLKYMAHDNVQPIPTTDSSGIVLESTVAIRAAFDKMGADKTKDLSLDPKSTNPDEVAAFQLMAAQTHVARAYQMLKDYRSELGDLTVSKVTIMTPENASKSYEYSIVISFGPGKAA
ncbi:hypothetical protein EJ05DRAFT_516642 [Pseudovirgaria hyperparasitica]|uniref:Uncharacterized protein n=1 Tax=Pseudovirgaria hyperparasitica TaxID=470096 RepID=A0A6A6WLZ6_9PEZI|nr:uncharacterized protein EJ05DRAFT_516642 [Pseudovirgaria hyperparasitica]KAF2763221.1 hypothetical protein EJ05DRAFT_516642 [Pseudovirgaria hyperparasitica]